MDEFLTEFDSKLFDTISKSAKNVYFFYADMKKGISRWSSQAKEYFGLESEILEPADKWSENILPKDRWFYDKNMSDMLNGITPYHSCEYRIKKANGKYVWVRCRGYMTYDADGAPEFFAGYVTVLGMDAPVDQVTDLWTVSTMRNHINDLLAKGRNGAILVLDVMNFKRLNAHYGRSFGDTALYEIGQILAETAGNHHATVYRYAANAFAILMKGSKDDLCALYADLREAVRNPKVNGRVLDITIYSGATLFPQDAHTYDDLDNNLVSAVSAAKNMGVTDRIVFYSGELVKRRQRMVGIEEAIRASIENNFEGFSVVFQPVFDAKTGKLHSAEALLRWQNDEFPDLSPAEFVPILERSKSIIPVGKWVVDKAFQHVAEWSKRDASNLPHVNINFSYIQFMDPTLKDYIIDKLNEYNLPHDLLVAELTESCRIEYSPHLADILQSLKDEGISVALDDFGTGYASLMLLKEMPTDIVKLDHTMMSTIHDRPKDRGLVEFIIKYCNEIGIDVCTEGVETKEIQDIVTAAGTAYLQGYYYDKPLKTDDFYEKYIK
ncbi:MAG: GGDEF and EAL domain-containing protein [Firmicutes bacterium]|nr:GGDEF and EAL domain-containing protein [Bacillota bacterium]